MNSPYRHRVPAANLTPCGFDVDSISMALADCMSATAGLSFHRSELYRVMSFQNFVSPEYNAFVQWTCDFFDLELYYNIRDAQRHWDEMIEEAIDVYAALYFNSNDNFYYQLNPEGQQLHVQLVNRGAQIDAGIDQMLQEIAQEQAQSRGGRMGGGRQVYTVDPRAQNRYGTTGNGGVNNAARVRELGVPPGRPQQPGPSRIMNRNQRDQRQQERFAPTPAAVTPKIGRGPLGTYYVPPKVTAPVETPDAAVQVETRGEINRAMDFSRTHAPKSRVTTNGFGRRGPGVPPTTAVPVQEIPRHRGIAEPHPGQTSPVNTPNKFDRSKTQGTIYAPDGGQKQVTSEEIWGNVICTSDDPGGIPADLLAKAKRHWTQPHPLACRIDMRILTVVTDKGYICDYALPLTEKERIEMDYEKHKTEHVVGRRSPVAPEREIVPIQQQLPELLAKMDRPVYNPLAAKKEHREKLAAYAERKSAWEKEHTEPVEVDMGDGEIGLATPEYPEEEPEALGFTDAAVLMDSEIQAYGPRHAVAQMVETAVSSEEFRSKLWLTPYHDLQLLEKTDDDNVEELLTAAAGLTFNVLDPQSLKGLGKALRGVKLPPAMWDTIDYKWTYLTNRFVGCEMGRDDLFIDTFAGDIDELVDELNVDIKEKTDEEVFRIHNCFRRLLTQLTSTILWADSVKVKSAGVLREENNNAFFIGEHKYLAAVPLTAEEFQLSALSEGKSSITKESHPELFDTILKITRFIANHYDPEQPGEHFVRTTGMEIITKDNRLFTIRYGETFAALGKSFFVIEERPF